jgi:putative Ca2+/H+ antiporter (TMEM165/GDT1 family)
MMKFLAFINLFFAVFHGPLASLFKFPFENWSEATFYLIVGIWLLTLSKEDN